MTGGAGTRRLARDRCTAAVAATTYLALGWCFREPPRGLEQRLFARLNHQSDDIAVLRVPQQLGTPWVLPAISATAFLLHRPHLALVAGCALPAEKALEVGVKKLLDRKRPAQSDPDAELHDDAPEDGPSYPSGHAAIAFTAVFSLAPHLPQPIPAVTAGVAAVASAVRVHQGAHFPVDAVGGALLGLAVGSGLTAVCGRPRTARVSATAELT